MSKNTNNQDYKQIGKILTELVLSERVTVIQILSKDWEEKITITRETKMEEIIQYLLKHNADIGKLELAYDCVKALRPEETPPMQIIKPVEGQESISISVEEKDKLIEVLEQNLNKPVTNDSGIVCLNAICTVGVDPVNPYEGMTREEAMAKINEEYYKGSNKPIDTESSGSSTPYWLAAGAAAVAAIGVGTYKVLTRSPTH